MLLSTHTPPDTSPGWVAHWKDFITQGGTVAYPRSYEAPDTAEPGVAGPPVMQANDLLGTSTLQAAGDLFSYNGIAWGQATAPAADWDMSTVTPTDVPKNSVPTLSSSWVYDFSGVNGTDYSIPSYVTLGGHVISRDELSVIVAGFFSRALELPILDGTNTDTFVERLQNVGSGNFNYGYSSLPIDLGADLYDDLWQGGTVTPTEQQFTDYIASALPFLEKASGPNLPWPSTDTVLTNYGPSITDTVTYPDGVTQGPASRLTTLRRPDMRQEYVDETFFGWGSPNTYTTPLALMYASLAVPNPTIYYFLSEMGIYGVTVPIADVKVKRFIGSGITNFEWGNNIIAVVGDAIDFKADPYNAASGRYAFDLYRQANTDSTNQDLVTPDSDTDDGDFLGEQSSVVYAYGMPTVPNHPPLARQQTIHLHLNDAKSKLFDKDWSQIRLNDALVIQGGGNPGGGGVPDDSAAPQHLQNMGRFVDEFKVVPAEFVESKLPFYNIFVFNGHGGSTSFVTGQNTGQDEDELSLAEIDTGRKSKLTPMGTERTYEFVFLGSCSSLTNPPSVEFVWNAEAIAGWTAVCTDRVASKVDKDFWQNVETGQTITTAINGAVQSNVLWYTLDGLEPEAESLTVTGNLLLQLNP